jgi:hypothetical protein
MASASGSLSVIASVAVKVTTMGTLRATPAATVAGGGITSFMAKGLSLVSGSDVDFVVGVVVFVVEAGSSCSTISLCFSRAVNPANLADLLNGRPIPSICGEARNLLKKGNYSLALGELLSLPLTLFRPI